MQQPSTDKKERVSDEILALRLLVKRQPSLMIYASKGVIERLQLAASGKVSDYETAEEAVSLAKFCAAQRRSAVTLEQNFVLVLEQGHTDLKSNGLYNVQHQFDSVCQIDFPSFPELGNGLMITMLKQRLTPENAECFLLNRVDPVV